MLLSPALCDQMRPKVITLIGAYNIFKKSFKFKFKLPFATQWKISYDKSQNFKKIKQNLVVDLSKIDFLNRVQLFEICQSFFFKISGSFWQFWMSSNDAVSSAMNAPTSLRK
jgi:hypothetical protein